MKRGGGAQGWSAGPGAVKKQEEEMPWVALEGRAGTHRRNLQASFSRCGATAWTALGGSEQLVPSQGCWAWSEWPSFP